MARPVRVQTTMVSAKTSKMPKKPCFTGSRSEVEAWAIGAEPSPASFENTPRRRPQLRQARTLMPAQTDCGLKAHTNMSRKTAGSLPAFVSMTARQQPDVDDTHERHEPLAHAAEPGHPAAEHGIAAQGDKQAYCEREYRTFGGEAGQQLHRERPGRAAYLAALDGAAHGEGCKHTGG